MNTNKPSLIALRKKAMEAPIGSEIKCPSCGMMHTKKAYNTIFCKSKGGSICKDNYWNNVTPSKRNNTTRISPANADYSAKINSERMGGIDGKKFEGYTSEGYRIVDGVAYDEYDEPMYDVDPYDDTHPFDVGDSGDKGEW